MSNSLVSNTNKPKTFQDLLISMKGQIEMAIPKHMTSDRMLRIALTAYNSNPKLKECDSMSILAAVMNSAQLGLEPNTPLGQAYIIPYGKKANFQIGYQGLIDLANRTKSFREISAHCVYQEDIFEYELGMDQKLIHKPAKLQTGEPIFYYARFKTVSDGQGFEVMSRDAVTRHAKKFSKAFDYGPWKSDFDAMAMKTVLIKVLKFAPKAIELANAISEDNSVKSDISLNMSEVKNEVYDIKTSDDFIDIKNPEPDRQQAETPVYQENNNPDTEYDPFNK